MGRNVWQYALLGGVAGGADGLARGIESERRFQQEKQLMAEREAERRRYLDDQQEGNKELAAARIAARTGGTGSRSSGSGGGATFDPATADANVAWQLGMEKDQVGDWANGEDLIKRTKMFDTEAMDGSGKVVDEQRPANFEELVASRRRKLESLRGGERHGKDFKDVAEGMATVEGSARLDRVEAGNRGATRAQLAAKGKGEFENSGEGGVFSTVDGSAKLNPLGEAKASKERAGASLDFAKAKSEADSAIAGGNTEKLHNLLNSVNKVLEDMTAPEATKVQFRALQTQIGNAINGAMGERTGGSPTPKPGAPKPGKPAAAPYPDGTRLKGKDGKTYVVQNGKPVPA